MANRNNLLAALKSFRKELKGLEEVLEKKNTKKLEKILDSARRKRGKLK